MHEFQSFKYVEKCFLHFYENKKDFDQWLTLLDLNIFSFYEEDLQKIVIITVPKFSYSPNSFHNYLFVTICYKLYVFHIFLLRPLIQQNSSFVVRIL